MSAIAINTNYVNLNSRLAVGNEGIFSIESTDLKLPIDEGDDLLFLKKHIGDDLEFSSLGLVTRSVGRELKPAQNINQKIKTKPQRPKYLHKFEYKIESLLEKNNLLSELEYSLQFVENHNKPAVHFFQQYRNILTPDFETITNGWVYATRTVFGKLVNALPRQNRLEFALHAMDNFQTIDLASINILKGLNFLFEYIEKRILSRGRLLIATDNLLHFQLKDHMPANEVAIIDPDTEEKLNISAQATLFKKLFELEGQQSIETFLKKTVHDNPDIEARFQKIFKRRSWPIDLGK